MSSSGKPLIHIVYYSLYGHILALAKSVAKGVEATGAKVKLFQIKETLSDDILTKMGAPAKPDEKEIPIATLDSLTQCDGLIFGIPTRYGTPAGQFKAFWDATGQLWQQGALVGKPYSIFVSTGTLGGGQEATALTSIPNFVHHGMIYIPLGYTDKSMFSIDEVHGGSPWGAGTLAGTGARQPSAFELALAQHQGTHSAKLMAAFKLGKEALAAQGTK